MKIRNFFRNRLVAHNGVRRGNTGHSHRFGTRLARFESLEQRTLLSVSPMDGYGFEDTFEGSPHIDDGLKAVYAEYTAAPDDFQSNTRRRYVEDGRVTVEVHVGGKAETAEGLRALGLEIYDQWEDSIITGFLPIERLVDVMSVDGVQFVLSAGKPDSRGVPDSGGRPGSSDWPDHYSPEYINSPLNGCCSEEMVHLYLECLASPESFAAEHSGLLNHGRLGVSVGTLRWDTEGRVELLKSIGMEVSSVSEEEIRGWLPVESFMDLTDVDVYGPLWIQPGGSPTTMVHSPHMSDKVSDIGPVLRIGLGINVYWDAEVVNKVDMNLVRLFHEYKNDGWKDDITTTSPWLRATRNPGHSSLPGYDATTSPWLKIDGDRVYVNVGTADFVAGWHDALTDLGMEMDVVNGSCVSGWLPLGVLGEVAELDSVCMVDSVVQPWYLFTNNTVSVSSQDDLAQRSDDLRTSMGLDGTGVTIDVISDGYDTFGFSAVAAFARYDVALQFHTKHFEHTHGYAENVGNNAAHLYDDSSTIDALWAENNQAKVENTSVGWSRIAEAFDAVYAHSSDGLDDNEDLPDPLSLLDFTLDLSNWDG